MLLLASSSLQFLYSSPCRNKSQIKEMYHEAFSVTAGVSGGVLLVYKSTTCKRWNTACPAQRSLIFQANLTPTLPLSDSLFVMCQPYHLKLKCSQQFIWTLLTSAKAHDAKGIVFVSRRQDNKKSKPNHYTLGEPQTSLWLAYSF